MGDRDDATIPDTPSATTAQKRLAKLPPRYRLGDVLGEGGMGRVYRAYDSTLARDVAIKLIEREARGTDRVIQIERFVREARAAARLIHPNIVAVHDVDPEAGWLVMALVSGKSLRDLPAPASPALAANIARQVLSALAAAHAASVVHRDIKPSNIIVGPDDHVTLVDFGIAHLLDGEMTRTGESLGTPAYASPEQLRGAPVDARTDLYALGATLYELVVGERLVAFEAPAAASLDNLRARCGEQRGLARLIAGCLPGDPRARFQSAKEALAALDDEPAKAIDRARVSPPARRRVALYVATAVTAIGAVAGAWWWKRPAPIDRRVDEAFLLAQRGEHERAGQILDDYLGEHPRDPNARVLRLLTAWWDGSPLQELEKRALDAPLTPVQRAMVRSLDLVAQNRGVEAAGYLETVLREHPDAPELTYILGEAHFHAGRIDDGLAALERAFALDPRWQMALHHPIEVRLTRAEPASLEPLAARLRTVDPAAASALDCKIAIGSRDYPRAIAAAQAGIDRGAIAELYICLSHALALAGDLDAGAAAAKRAFELWPIDLREWGGFSLHAEYLLYRGRLDEYLTLLWGKDSRQRTFALAMWRPPADLTEPAPSETERSPTPFGAALWILVGKVRGRDEHSVYDSYPEPEIRAYGQGLWAESRGDHATAIARYREGLAVPAKGDVRMLLSHHLARVLHSTGDRAGASAACEAVIAPRMYYSYRAVVLPDCLLWSEDPARWRQLVDAWRDSTFAHPAVLAARQRLAGP